MNYGSQGQLQTLWSSNVSLQKEQPRFRSKSASNLKAQEH